MSFILALDEGTTSARAIVFDHAGAIRSVAQKEFTQVYPHPGWVEHDPNEIWAAQIAVASEAIARAGIHARDVAAIGITNQRETTVVWDRKSGEPICNAIVWQDRRTAGYCDELKAGGQEPLITDKTGLVLDAYFSGTKLKWLLDNVPAARESAAQGRLAFGTIDTWLIWKLSGGAHYTDPSNASRTLLYNIHTGAWDEEMLAIFGVPRGVLPEICPSSAVVARTAGNLFAARIPIAGIAGDQQAALFGQRCVAPGAVKNTYGTGCFILMYTGERPVPSRNRLLTTAACQTGAHPEYALEGSVFIAGAVVQWLRDGLGIIKSSAEVEQLAASVADNGGVYLVPAFTGVGSPHWDPYARGMIHGLTRGATAGHIARAALESIAYQTADVLHAMESDSGIRLVELRVDGGAARNDMLMQFQADLLGVPVVRPKITETTALGAAYLAGLAVGYWKDEKEIAAQWQVQRVFEPGMARSRVQALMAGWRKALERAKNWASPD
ncbi:MAG: glycerol kinase [Betaproteobacteria bacterium RIFCSPLOWO2_12_FULL_62_13]|nr:MAG: glycerol kinase [Betaproteobacteria bacterium RIFCSPLOWO2_12_FULL_62_13]